MTYGDSGIAKTVVRVPLINPIINELNVFTVNGVPELAQSVCDYLKRPLGQDEVFYLMIRQPPRSTLVPHTSLLRSTNFLESTLEGADFTGSNLSYANLKGASLADVNLVNANLLNANLNHSKLMDVDLSGANLTGVRLANLLTNNIILKELYMREFTVPQ